MDNSHIFKNYDVSFPPICTRRQNRPPKFFIKHYKHDGTTKNFYTTWDTPLFTKEEFFCPADLMPYFTWISKYGIANKTAPAFCDDILIFLPTGKKQNITLGTWIQKYLHKKVVF